MTSSSGSNRTLGQAVLLLAIVLTAATLCFTFFLKFHSQPPAQNGQGGRFFAIWFFGALILGVPCLKGVEARGGKRLAIMALYLPASAIFLYFVFGIFGKLLGVFEGI